MSIEKTIVAFHIGRGGRFHNQGHVSFLGEAVITKYVDELFLNYENEKEIAKRFDREEADGAIESGKADRFRDLCNERNLEAIAAEFEIDQVDLGEYIYTDGNSNPVGLTYEEGETGIGLINIDGDYDTTYCQRLEDCTDSELQIIVDSENKPGYYCSADVIEYAKQALDIEEEEIDDEE